MEAKEFLGLLKGKCTTQKTIKIEIEGYADIETSGEIELVYMDGELSIYLGEYDNWYYIAPIKTMVAEKCADGEFTYIDEYIQAKDLMELLDA